MLLAVATHLWQSTVFAGVVWLLTLALRRNRAAVRHGLWLAASVKFLAPLALLVGIGNSVEWRKPAVNVPSRMVAVSVAADPFAYLAPPQPLVWAPKRASRTPRILFAVWLCGFAANLIAWWRRWRRVRLAVRAASPAAVGWPIYALSGPARLEPGVFGVLRPFLLLPEGIKERLRPAQFDAVVMHELCHLRRRDNLAAAIHMVVEALFWFHPLVWWMQTRLVAEREQACDEEVLRMGNDPREYAEGIVSVAKFYLESPLACVAGVTGGGLTQRVEAIMLNRGTQPVGLPRGLLVTVAGALAVAAPVILGILNPVPLRAGARSFETVSIHQVRPVDGMIRSGPPFAAAGMALSPTKLGTISGTRFDMPIGTVKSLIMDAYNATDQQIDGLPAWAAGAEFYAIHGQAGGELPLTQDQLRPMLQTLLADRFRLRAHGETRDVPMYELKSVAGGSKVKPSATGASWPMVRWVIQMFAGRPVLDRTGFSGLVEAPSLDWPDLRAKLKRGQEASPELLQELGGRLGLTLKPIDQPTDFLVVDGVERPRED